MEMWDIVAYLGIVFTSAQTIPQIAKVLRTRKTRDLSMGLMATMTGSSVCWMMVGVHMNNVQMVIANAICIGGALLLAYFKIREREEKPCRP